MRRNLPIIVALCAMVLTGCAQCGKKNGQDSELKLGVAGYSYRKFSIEQTLEYLKSINVHYLSIKDFWLPLDSTKEEMDAFKAKCAEYDVDGYILGPIYMKSEEAVDQAFAYAQRYGAQMFIGIPNYELLDYTIAKVKETGIRVAIHTHGPDGAAFPDIRTIVEKVGDPSLGVGCCMDLGHTFRMGWDPAEDIVKYRDWIYDIHIKDETAADKSGRTCECGHGLMDLPAIIRALKKINYQGVISMEFEKNPADPHPGVAESIGYLRGVIAAFSERARI
ncbi:MAG: sugar phosphate isomerase/epimerase [Bacteroidales bacterium]|nr:sugar phosphate isomerase/epimerase [Bacteroidales bacterium]